MINYYNPYNRIHFYYSCLNIELLDSYSENTATPTGYSINDLASISKIPKEIIRQDIYSLLLWQNKLLDFEEDSIPYIYFAKEIDSPSWEMLSSGELDTCPLILDTIDYTTYEIPITFEEQKALELLKNDSEHTPHLSFPSTTNLYKVKDSYRFYHNPHIIGYLNKINDAINSHQMIHIVYPSSTQHHQTTYLHFSFLPVKIAYDSIDNLYYVLSVGKKKEDIRTYRIDRIIHLEQKNIIHDYYPDLSFLMKIAPNVWGCNFSAAKNSDNLFHVKVCFSNAANVFNKVKKDLACRCNGHLCEKDGFLYYEDDVYGIDKFRSWIFSYGRAVTVLEPESLQKQIINSLKERL